MNRGMNEGFSRTERRKCINQFYFKYIIVENAYINLILDTLWFWVINPLKEVYINVVLDKSTLNVNLSDYLVLIFKIETRHCFVSIVMFKISCNVWVHSF